MTVYRFEVFGKPLTAGSKKPFRIPSTGKLIVTDDNPKTKVWKASVQQAAGETLRGEFFMNQPLILTAEFYFPRPKGHYRAGGQQLTRSSPVEHYQKPDLSKLIRALEDALKGVVYDDDSRIVRYGPTSGKYWTLGPARAVVQIATCEPTAVSVQPATETLPLQL